MSKLLTAVLFAAASCASAGETFTINSVNPTFYSHSVALYFEAGQTSFSNMGDCSHPHAHRMVVIDWNGDNDADRQGKALQVAAVLSYKAIGQPITITTGSCSSGGAAKVFHIK